MIDNPWRKSIAARKFPGLAVALTAAVSLGACAQSGGNADLFSMTGGNKQSKADTSKDPLEKVAHYSRRYTSDPKNKAIALEYARALVDSGQKKRALSVLRTASAHHRQDPAFISAYGRTALAAGRTDLAAKLLHKADNPANPDWRIASGLGTVLAKQGKYDEAVDHFERALKLAPSNPSAMSNLAMARAAIGDLPTAERLLRQATQMPMAKSKVHSNLALILKLQGRDAEANKIKGTKAPVMRSSVGPVASTSKGSATRVSRVNNRTDFGG